MSSALRFYKEAIRFDFEHDQSYFSLMGIDGALRWVPRSYIFFSRLPIWFGKIIKKILLFLIILWISFGHLIFATAELIRSLLFNGNHCLTKCLKRIYIDLSEINNFLLINSNDSDYPQAIISTRLEKERRPGQAKLPWLQLYKCMTFFETLSAFAHSVASLWYLFFSKERNLLLYTYSSFLWFSFYFFLRRKGIDSIWLSNHHDRWNILVESIPNVEVTIIQHGSLGFKPQGEQDRLFPSFSRKLHKTKRIYFFDIRSQKIFEKYNAHPNIEYIPFSKKITVSDWRDVPVNCTRVLIVGHENEIPYHRLVVSTLKKEFGTLLDIAYKYHPRQKTKLQLQDVWERFDTVSVPLADIVITYGSSLDHDITDLIHCELIHYDFLNREESLEEILKKIASCDKKNHERD